MANNPEVKIPFTDGVDVIRRKCLNSLLKEKHVSFNDGEVTTQVIVSRSAER